MGPLNGMTVRHSTNTTDQNVFDKLDTFIKETLLRGVKIDDAERMCKLQSAKQMWDLLQSAHTKREYSNHI